MSTEIYRKLVIVGDKGTGKTHFILAAVKKKIPQNIGPFLDPCDLNVKVNGKLVKLDLRDTYSAEENDFYRFRPLSYPDTDVVLICFAIDSYDALENVSQRWVPEVRHYCPAVPIVLVGTKKDLQSNSDTAEKGWAVAKEVGAQCYMECSAKTGEGVQEVIKYATAQTNVDLIKPHYHKVVIVGDVRVGRTYFVCTAMKKGFSFDDCIYYIHDPCDLDVEVNGKLVKLGLWDTPGTEDFDRIRPFLYYTNADVFLICFAVDSYASLENVYERWVPEVWHHCPTVPFILVGTKTDLRSDPETIEKLQKTYRKPPVPAQKGWAVARELRAQRYMECSAKTGEGVQEVLKYAATQTKVEAGFVSPYEGHISMNSLRALEEMVGIEILTKMAERPEAVRKFAKKVLNPEQQRKLESCETETRRLEVIVEQWKSGKSHYPPTWDSLLYILSMLDMDELRQQIEDYFGKADYFSTYNQALATHKIIEMWFIKVILLGAPRLGKTTVRRRLTNQIKDISSSGEAVQPSTGTVESAPGVVIRNLSGNTAVVTSTEWTASKDLTDEARLFIQFFHSQIHQKLGPSKKPKQKFERLLKDMSKGKATNPSLITKIKGNLKKKPQAAKSSPKDPSSEQPSKQRPAMAEVNELFRNAVGPKYWKEIEHLFTDSAFIKMEDTGGQPEFMDMLPALTIGPALYLLFCRLIDELKSRYTVSYLSPSGESTTPEESTYTMEEVLLTALASISCFKSSSNLLPSVSTGKPTTASSNRETSHSSLAYIVGTHKDLVSEEQIDKFDGKLQQSIRSTDFFKEGLVKFSSEHRMVFPIDNMNGGESEIKKIQKFLEEGMKQHFKKLRIPVAWLVLSLCLRKREERTASLQDVLKLAKDIGIPKKEATSALQFLHHYAGALMYFPELEELRDMVICDTQVVYDSASNLIVNTFKFDRVGKVASERFRETGQFSLSDIKGAIENISGDYIPLLKLVKLLEYLNIITPILQSTPTPSQKPSSPQSSDMTYFMPCVLKNATHEDLDRWWATASDPLSPAPLFIRYKCGYVPIGVFPAMIANLAGQESCLMIYDGIRKNRVMFLLGSDFDMVTLVSHPKYYAIQLRQESYAKTSAHEACRRVRELIESTLQTVTSHMNYTFQVEYQFSFECPSHPGREHLCVVKSTKGMPQAMLCLGNTKNPQPKALQSQHLVWFTEATLSAHSSDAPVPAKVQPLTVRDYSSYMSSLPVSARPHLELQLDWGHEGVDKDLNKIADHMLDWEEKLSTHLGLTRTDVNDTKEMNPFKPALQRIEALRRWKNKQRLKATYGNLLEVFVKAGHTQCAEALCEVLREKYSEPSAACASKLST